jgi:RNA polymerase sigma-70 factor (ECF subfamily)
MAASEHEQGQDDDVPVPQAPPRAPLDEHAVLARFLAGDEAAFALLVVRYHARLVRLARIYVADASAAEEVAQETWLAVLDGLAGFQGRSSLKTWIFRILTNRAKTRGVRDKRSVPFSALGRPDDDPEPAVEPARFGANGTWSEPPVPWEADTPERILARREALETVRSTVEALPEAQRAVIVLRDIEGLDSREVCEMLELSEGNQRVLLHRARSRVRRALEEQETGR